MFNINGVNWDIKRVSFNHPSIRRIDNSVALASCDNTTKTIYLSETIPKDKLKKVLCHELTHAAMFSYDIDLSFQQEEILADLIATYGQEIVHATNLVFKRIIEKRGRH